MTGPRTDMGEAEFLQEFPDIARMKVDAEPLGDDTLEVNAPPAHDAILLTVPILRADLNQPRRDSGIPL